MKARSPSCPTCGPDATVTCLGKRNALYPAGCLMIIGFPFAILHQTSSPMEYRCETCQCKFGVRSILARISLAILIAIPLFLIGSGVYVFFNR